ncbi:aspartic protease 2B [Aphelenchoides avenae]|nr:aspartic protease 2B [Aphelenchus avenae]
MRSLVLILVVSTAFWSAGKGNLHQEAALKPSKQPYSVQYVGEVQIGTPPQNFAVQIDPFSSLLWVLDSTYHYCRGFECSGQLQPCPGYCRDKVFCKKLCEESCCSGSGAIKSTFKSSASSTYRKNGTEYDLIVDDIEGFYGIDKLQIGNLSIAEVYFGQTDFLENWDFVPSDGVLGLAYELSNFGTNPVKPFVQQLVDSGTMKQPIFSVYMSNEKNPEIAGTITYGDYDDEHCERPSVYRDIVQGYDFAADYVKIGSTLFRPVQSTSVTITSGFTDAYLGVPHSQLDAALKVFGGVYNRATGEYEIKCDAKLPSVVISFRSQQLTVAADALISDTPNGNGTCELKIYGFSDREYWLFGSALARSYCQVFNLGKKTVGFAKVKSKAG